MSRYMGSKLSRRRVVAGLAAATLLPGLLPIVHAQSASPPAGAASQLPLRTTGLEHMGVIVPDVTAAGKFYGRLFNPELHKEKELPLRYYVTLGVGYLALGSRANESRVYFDHFCALVQDYNAPAMAEELKAAGLPAGRFGIIPDPDGIGFQLLPVPGGLAKSTEPAGRIVEGDALVQPIGLSEVVLHVPDIDKALAFYRQFFGKEAERTTQAAVFQVADTKLRIERTDDGEAPRVNRIVVKVKPFDHATVSAELKKLGATIEGDSKDSGKGGAKRDSKGGKALRFRDPLGLGLELVPV